MPNRLGQRTTSDEVNNRRALKLALDSFQFHKEIATLREVDLAASERFRLGDLDRLTAFGEELATTPPHNRYIVLETSRDARVIRSLEWENTATTEAYRDDVSLVWQLARDRTFAKQRRRNGGWQLITQ